MRKRDPFAELGPLVERVYAYVGYRIGEGSRAEEITKMAFDRALRHRPAFDPRTDEQGPWLVGLARQVLREHGVKDPDFHEDAGTALDEQARELIGLHYGAELTVAQIADLLGLDKRVVVAGLSRSVRDLTARASEFL